MNKAFEIPSAASKGDYLVVTGEHSQVVPRAQFHAIMAAAKNFSDGNGGLTKKVVAPIEQISKEKRLCLGVLAAAEEPFSAGDVRDNIPPGRIALPTSIPARLEALVREGNAQKLPVEGSRRVLYAITAKGKRTFSTIPA